MVSFTPKSKEETQRKEFPLLPKGEYDFEVISSKEKTSKAGNPMFEINLKVFGPDGQHQRLFDYLLLDDSGQWKLRHFCEATGMLDRYESGDLDEGELEGQVGRVKIKIQPAKDGYPEKNAVEDYIPTDEAAANKTTKQAKENSKRSSKKDLNDDIPW